MVSGGGASGNRELHDNHAWVHKHGSLLRNRACSGDLNLNFLSGLNGQIE